MSTFVGHHTNPLILASIPASPPSFSSLSSPSPTKHELSSILLSLQPPLTSTTVRKTLESLQALERSPEVASSAGGHDPEELALKAAILGRITVGLYAEALDSYLAEASDAETEAEWWGEVERSSTNVAYYLLQTLPGRLLQLAQTILQAIHAQKIPLRLRLLYPSELNRLLSTQTSHPNILSSSLFPHIRTHPHSLSLSLSKSSFHRPHISIHRTTFISLYQNLVASFSRVSAFVNLPVELTRQECKYKRRELEKVRNERAESLGVLSALRDELACAIEEQRKDGGDKDKLLEFVLTLERVVSGGADLSASPQHEDLSPSNSPHVTILSSITNLANHTLPNHNSTHISHLHTASLLRPSRLTLLWPRLLLLPPLTVYAASWAWRERGGLEEMVRDGWETVKGFWWGWIVDPLRDVFRTVRAGGEGGVIVSKEGVEADQESLERMVLALARDKLGYGTEQLEELSRHIRVGDLTPVMEIYEEDIKSPLKSAVAGTLLRGVFIQVQKAKVDIDQALSGIDKLLKSQELTFAFVGVAPAFAVVYVIGEYLRNVWVGGKGRGKFGGRRRRGGVWLAMRRIEKLLISQPHSIPPNSIPSQTIPPLTSGLMLISLAHLRKWAMECLPVGSRVREGFLEDVEDLEGVGLGRGEKLRVVERMWRCWGGVLGWEGEGGR
ncbi:hypothetical protein JAAARDRAFT_122431 [Jaapia argillacea MUCL 33604]|uniref:NCA2-domain-containing protein n=1 Tax=Jaapia argillacea MUCL 33604 TaxID=933084 RepID=A0A067Q5Z6_9AGAM|nr:hypothetical protein JAAARDRAFT_122431 [Jaapia argillacea MUCL 33604]